MIRAIRRLVFQFVFWASAHCLRCEGRGKVMHHGMYSYGWRDCSLCNGLQP